MPNDNRALKVFLCHAHSDKDAVKALYARLKREGVDVWLDKEKLLPGADWELEIRKAVREADVVVVCLSKQFNQAGFRQKEVRIALDAAMEKPEGEIFIIPARLEECDTLESLSKWHWVDLFESDGFQRLILALRVRADKIGAALRQRGRATVSRPKVNAEQEVARAKEKLEAEELEKQKAADVARIAREKAEKEAAEKARLEAEELERQRLAKEKADREAAREKAEKEVAEKARLEAEEAEKRRIAKKKAYREFSIKARLALKTVGIPIGALLGIALLGMLAIPGYKFLRRALTSYPEPTGITDDFGVEMMLVPAGDFQMGSAWYHFSTAFDEKAHTVYLDDFYMDKYEVTNDLYKACVDAGGCTAPDYSSRYYDTKYEDHPVVYVDWNQGKTYCEWRKASLPTEAQWEKAARGTDGRTYPWGEGIDCDKANYYLGNNRWCIRDTTPVGNYEGGKSPYGIYALAGNVMEWTSDWYSETYYQSSPSKNPLGPDSGQFRVLRGGAWVDVDFSVRSALRDWDYPTYSGGFIGFRCARSLP